MSDEQVFNLPDVGEGLTEAEVVAWHVKVGDQVDLNDTLVDVETAKSVVELPSPYAGVVRALHAAEGDTVDVGAPLISIDVAARVSGAAGPRPSAPVEPSTPVEPADPTPEATVEGAALDAVEEAAAAPAVLVGTGPKQAVARRVHVRPPSGPQFERPRPSAPQSAPESAPKFRVEAGDEVRTAVKGVRKATAEAMVRSAFTAPHAGMWTTVDVTASMGLVDRLRRDREWADVRVTPLLVIARTVALAVRRYPEINASWDDASQEIVRKPTLNLGVAAATPRGLMVPNIKDAGALSLRELAMALDDVVTRARAGKLTPADMSGGTLTLTNVGTFGVEGATPILNPPEASILALGAVQRRPWVVDETIAIRDVMTLSISIDHRLVDGELGASVLRHVADLLSDPARALL